MTCGGRERDREKEEGRVEGGEGEREGEREWGRERGREGKRKVGTREMMSSQYTHTQCQSSHLPHLVQPVDVQVVSLYWFGNPGYDLLCQVFQELFSHASDSYSSYSLLTEVGNLSRGEAHYTTDCDFRLASRFLSKVHVYQITGCQSNSLHLQRTSHSTHTIGTEESVLVREVS